MDQIRAFLNTLGISEDDALRALLSAFVSIQPGSMRQGFLRRPDYGGAPSTDEIWQLLVESQFRCSLCDTHYDLTLDHKDRNTRNNDISNLRVYCRDCNRSVNSRGLLNRAANLRIYKAIVTLVARYRRFPTDVEIRKEADVSQISGSTYMIRFFRLKYASGELCIPTENESTMVSGVQKRDEPYRSESL